MEQREIQIRTSDIIAQYAKRNGRSFGSVNIVVMRALLARGITPYLPMYHAAKLLVLRDVFNELEGTYTNPAEL